MKVKFITSACFEVEYTDGFRVLNDPWLSEGIYYGTWFHSPPLKQDWIKYYNDNPPDAIYISHIHWDHLDPDTLKQFTFKCPIFTGPFNHNIAPMQRLIEDCGFKLTFTNSGPRVKLWKADGPECDSFALFTDPAGVNILNLNDCVYDEVKEQMKELPIGDIDLAAIPYAGAGPYPQCFDMPEEDKKAAKEKSIATYLGWVESYKTVLKPKEVMLIAGGYKLADESLNPYLAIPKIDGLPKEGQDFFIGIRKLLNIAFTRFKKHYAGISDFCIVTEKDRYEFVNSPEAKTGCLEIRLPEKLLWECLTKRKHWNNAELGNLLRFKREGKYDKDLHYCLSFFHI